MTEKSIQFRKKRELSEIISVSFDFLKQEYQQIFKLVSIYVLPFIILYAYVQVNVQMKIMGNVDLSNLDALMADPDSLMAKMGPLYSNVFLAYFFNLFVQSLLIATFYSYLEVYIKKGKGNFELSEITPHLFSNGLLALGANLILFIIVTIGIILCIVPGFYFANTFSIIVMVVMFERKGISHGLTRTFLLVNSQWWNTLLINILGLILLWTIGLISSIPTMFSGISVDLFNPEQVNLADLPQWYWILSGISTVVSSLFFIIPYTFWAFHYFNLDERTKAFLPPSENTPLN